MKSTIKSLTKAQKKRGETTCIGEVVDGKQLIGHDKNGRQIWKKL
jgi:hypothetical protein